MHISFFDSFLTAKHAFFTPPTIIFTHTCHLQLIELNKNVYFIRLVVLMQTQNHIKSRI